MGRKHHIPLEHEFDEYDKADTKYIVLLDDEYPFATCRFYPLGEDSVMIGRVVVLPEYRGKGLGKCTMEEAEQWIKELGYSRIVLESRENKIAFYEKLGYVPDYNKKIEGITFTCISMEKKI